VHVTVQAHLHFYEGIPYAENNGGRTLHFEKKSGKLKEKTEYCQMRSAGRRSDGK